MGRGFDADDDEYLELLSEYERYVQHSSGMYEDFDEWLEVTYGSSKKKAIKRPNRRSKDKDY